MYLTQDDYGTSYYVRGASNYNFIKFGKDSSNNDYWWRIIRINGDGSIRLIYQGTAASGSTPALTGSGTSINSSESISVPTSFNINSNNNMHIGYMYTSEQRQGLTNSSNAKTQLEAWYKRNFVDRAANATAKSYIADRIFCGDRTSSTSSSATWTVPFTSSGGTGSTTTYYGADFRLTKTTKTPTLICPEYPDKYTTTNADHGNKALTYPIGLITADEVAMAGGVFNTANSRYYLYTNQYYWTMSPCIFSSGSAYEWNVGPGGHLNSLDVSDSYDLRAVINLSSDAPISGTGTTTSPFTIGPE